METERFALDSCTRLDRDPAVRSLDLGVARRRGLQSEIDEILILRRSSFLERRVHGRCHGIGVGVHRVCVSIVARRHVVLRGDVLFRRGLLGVVVAIVVRGLRGRLLGGFVRDGRKNVQLVRMVGQEAGHRRLLVMMMVAVGATAVGTVRAQASAVTTLGAAGRSVPFASAASKRLHASPAAAGSHALGARVTRPAPAGPQLELQQTDLSARSQFALSFVRPALELHDGLAFANQAPWSLSILPRPALELQDQFLVEAPPLRGLHAVLSKILWSAFDL